MGFIPALNLSKLISQTNSEYNLSILNRKTLELIENSKFIQEKEWNKFLSIKEFGIDRNSIEFYIFRDDICSIKQSSQDPLFDINSNINVHPLNPFPYFEMIPSLLECSAFHGSLKCYRYLMINGATLTFNKERLSILHLSIIGTCYEIFRSLFKSQIMDMECFKLSIKSRQHDIFLWLCENSLSFDFRKEIEFAIISFNNCVLLSMENEMTFNEFSLAEAANGGHYDLFMSIEKDVRLKSISFDVYYFIVLQ